MLRVPGLFLVLLQRFAPLFRARSWRHAEVLLVGAILAPGQRTEPPRVGRRPIGLGHAARAGAPIWA